MRPHRRTAAPDRIAAPASRAGVRRAGAGVGAALAATLALIAGARAPAAAPLAAGGGFDYFSGPGGQITRSALAIASLATAGGGAVTLAGIRFDDSDVGAGTAVLGAVAAPLAPAVSLRAWGTRYLGDGAFRAWRLKAGPWVGRDGGPNLGLAYQRSTDNAGGRSDAAIAEAAMPLAPRWTGRASAAYASVTGSPNAAQAALGLDWSPTGPLTLSADVGLARNGALATAPVPRRGLLGLPLLGGGQDAAPAEGSRGAAATVLLGMRLLFP